MNGHLKWHGISKPNRDHFRKWLPAIHISLGSIHPRRHLIPDICDGMKAFFRSSFRNRRAILHILLWPFAGRAMLLAIRSAYLDQAARFGAGLRSTAGPI